MIISQFGLMFLDDPVAAFTNIRRALAPGGRLAFITWQPLEANEWVMQVGRPVSRHTELPLLGGLAGGPGMFALKARDEAIEEIHAALRERYEPGIGIRLGTGAWLVTAH